jgi:hypothetical protein
MPIVVPWIKEDYLIKLLLGLPEFSFNHKDSGIHEKSGDGLRVKRHSSGADLMCFLEITVQKKLFCQHGEKSRFRIIRNIVL